MSEQYRATIKQWGDITGTIVLDPDGFDRKDPRLMERLFTYQEFQHGCMESTIQRRVTVMNRGDKPKGVLPFSTASKENKEITE